MKDSVVVITGASHGLGKVLASLSVSEGARVVICGRNSNELTKTAEEVGATAFIADVTKESDVRALADFAVSTFGSIDIWINNAAQWLPYMPAEELNIDRARAIFDVNVFGLMHGTQAALRQMKLQERGTIVNINSVSGLSGRPRSSGYAASKWAARGFTESVYEEYKDSPIRILAVYPGGMKTNLFDEKKPADFDRYMTPESVAEKIIANLLAPEPERELVLRIPSA